MDFGKIVVCCFAYFICCVASVEVVNYSWCRADSQETFTSCMQQKYKLIKTSPVNSSATAENIGQLFQVVEKAANPHNLDVMLPIETNDETILTTIKDLYSSTPYAQSKLVVLTGEVFQLRTSDPAALITADVFERFSNVFPDQIGINTDPKVFWAFTLSQEKGVLGFTTENINQIKEAVKKTKIKNLGIVIDAAIASNSNAVELMSAVAKFKYVILESRENEVEYYIKGLVALYALINVLSETEQKLALKPEVFEKVREILDSWSSTTIDQKKENRGSLPLKSNLNLIFFSIVSVSCLFSQ